MSSLSLGGTIISRMEDIGGLAQTSVDGIAAELLYAGNAAALRPATKQNC